MNARSDCIVCLLNQLLYIGRMSGIPEERLENLFHRFIKELPSVSAGMSPPAIAAVVTERLAEESGIADPYKKIKDESSRAAMALYPSLKKRVKDSQNPFAEALGLAIAGNLIDFGAKASLNLDDALAEILEQPLFRELENGGIYNDPLFQYDLFRTKMDRAADIMYITDNAGEIVFDRVFAETILEEFPRKRITFAVRGKEALNDALMEDALACGLDGCAEVISSGSPAAGTILDKCGSDFLDRLNRADLVISKGQGNYESLAGADLPETFFLFRIKCRVVAEYAGGPLGKLVLSINKKGARND